MDKICHIVVAGGSGSRFASELPKQFHTLGDRPLLMHTIDALTAACEADVVVAMHPQYIDVWHDLCRRHGFTSPKVVSGGATRWHSVKNALEAVAPDATIITVHDAARPFVTTPMLSRAIEAVKQGAVGAVPAIAVSDSLREIAADGSSKAVERARYRAVQTPQVFDAATLRSAYDMPYRAEFTDDASVVEAAGFRPIALVEGSPYNIKITHPMDIATAETYLRIKDGLSS